MGTPAGAGAGDLAQVKVLSVLLPGRRLLHQAGSTVPVIAQDGPITERCRGKHPDELLQSSGAALVSWYERRQVTMRESGCFCTSYEANANCHARVSCC